MSFREDLFSAARWIEAPFPSGFCHDTGVATNGGADESHPSVQEVALMWRTALLLAALALMVAMAVLVFGKVERRSCMELFDDPTYSGQVISNKNQIHMNCKRPLGDAPPINESCAEFFGDPSASGRVTSIKKQLHLNCRGSVEGGLQAPAEVVERSNAAGSALSPGPNA
jgi:hypothetical protein